MIRTRLERGTSGTGKFNAVSALLLFCAPTLFAQEATFAQDAYKELNQAIKASYDGQVLVVVRDGLMAGEYEKQTFGKGKAGLSYFHFDGSLAERPKKVSVGGFFQEPLDKMNQVDDQTFCDVSSGLNVTKLVKGEQVRVNKFYMRDNYVELLVEPLDPSHLQDLDMNKASGKRTTTFSGSSSRTRVRVAGFGTRMMFYFDRENILDKGDQKSVEQTIGRFLVPKAEAEKVLAEQSTVEIVLGESEESVVAKLGVPVKAIKVGSDKILKFKDMTVTLRDGKVAEVKVE